MFLYCLYGTTSFVGGKGEIVAPIKPMPPCWVVLVKPRISVSTRTVFPKVDVTKIHHPNIAALRTAIASGDYQQMIANMGNDLDTFGSTLPIIQQIKDRMMKYGEDIALMSDSSRLVLHYVKNILAPNEFIMR